MTAQPQPQIYLTVEQTLDTARGLIQLGNPVFLTDEGRYPTGWQQTVPDVSVVDRWRPGLALGLVCGHGLDVIDVDPRNGGDLAALADVMPTVYAVAQTKSGGWHLFVKSIGVRSINGFLPGIDLKAGDAEGRGRGFVWIAPSAGVSKGAATEGQRVAYGWLRAPDLAQLGAVLRGDGRG